MVGAPGRGVPGRVAALHDQEAQDPVRVGAGRRRGHSPRRRDRVRHHRGERRRGPGLDRRPHADPAAAAGSGVAGAGGERVLGAARLRCGRGARRRPRQLLVVRRRRCAALVRPRLPRIARVRGAGARLGYSAARRPTTRWRPPTTGRPGANCAPCTAATAVATISTFPNPNRVSCACAPSTTWAATAPVWPKSRSCPSNGRRSRAAFFEAVAKDAPRGSFPRGIGGEQVYWTVVGADGDAREGLLSEDGMLETGKGSFSIEPFLYVNGSLITWADVQPVQSLERRLAAHPLGDVGGGRPSTHDHRVCRRRPRGIVDNRPLPRPQPGGAPRERRALPGHPPLPGEPAHAVPEHARRLRADPRDRARGSHDPGERGPRDHLSHPTLELRCDSLRRGRRGDRLPSVRQRAPVHGSARSLRSRLGGHGLHARSRSRRRRGDRHPGASLRGIARTAKAVGSGGKPLGGRADRAQPRGVGIDRGSGRHRGAGRREAGGRIAPQPARLHPRQPGRPRDPARAPAPTRAPGFATAH